MSRGSQLLKNTGILMIARISTQLVSFILLPLYTALLSTEQYGQIDIYTSLSMIILPLVTLQLEMGLFRYFIVSDTKNDKKIVMSSAYAIMGAMLVASIIVFALVTFFVPLEHKVLLFCYYVSMILIAIFFQTARAFGKNIVYAFASFLSPALTVVLNLVFVLCLRWGVQGILCSTILANCCSGVYMLCVLKPQRWLQVKSIRKTECKRLLTYSVPLVFNQIASWAINYSDRLVILFYFGESMNGIYAVANKFSNIMGTFFNVYNIAWTENVVRCIKDKDSERYVSQVFHLTFNVYLLIVTGILNFLPFVFPYFVNENFDQAYQHIPLLLLGMLFSGMSAVLGSIYIAYEKTKNVSITTMLAGVCNVVIHLLLLPFIGLYAASISTLVSFFLLFVYRCMFLGRFFVLHFEIKKVLLQFLICLLVWGVYASRNLMFVAVGIIVHSIYVALFLWKNKTLLCSFIHKSQK